MARPSSSSSIRAQRLLWLFACAACTSEFPLGAWGAGGDGGNTEGGRTAGGGVVGAGGSEVARGGSGLGGSGAGGSGGDASGAKAGSGTATGGAGGSGGVDSAGAAGSGGESGEAGHDNGSGGTAGRTGCQTPGTILPLNGAGSDVDVTTTSTDFTWSTAFDSTEIELVVESEHVRDGYFWAYQFGLEGNPGGGFVGLQANGGYQAVPPNGEVELTTMAVFWIGGAPLKAELGSIAFPDARTYLKVDNPATTPNPNTWWTIHAKYPFSRCRPYRFRVAHAGQETNGDIWYGAWIHDVQANADTYLGRILVPAAWGQIRSTSAFTDRIGWGTPTSCTYPEYASGRFSFPTAGDGSLSPLTHPNRFAMPAHCGTSRFTELVGGVRHELSVH